MPNKLNMRQVGKKKKLKVKRDYQHRCEICTGDTDVHYNNADTKFCNHCHHQITRTGNVYRGPDHPDYDRLGYQVYEGDIP